MRKLFLLMISVIMSALGVMAQTSTYHGTILDAANNEPLIGATIMPVGGGQGTAADIDGNFTLTVPAKVKKAVISYVGYTSKTVDLKSGNMTIYLDSSATSLDDLVVVAYGTQTKESLTGSVAVIGSKEIEERPVTSVTAALEGNAPGIQVNNTVGTPGSSPDIRIRGFNSINGSNQPLYIVDGVPYAGSIADLNPADIESMSVLKDAASAALYGNKGANGVILITTKRAKNVGKIDVTAQVRLGMYTRGIPLYERLKASDWMQVAYDSQVNGAVSTGSFSDIYQARTFYNANFINSYANVNVFGVPNAELFNSDGRFVGGAPLPGYTDLDWWDAVRVKSGFRQEYNINAASATEKFNVFASVGYLKEHGYTLRTDFERFNARVNANYNPTSYLRFGTNISAMEQEQAFLDNMAGTTNDIFMTMGMAPIYPYYAHNEDGSVQMLNGEPVWNRAGYLQGTNFGYTARADRARNSATVIDGSLYGTAIIPYGFELTVRGTMHRDKTLSYSYMNNVMGSGVASNGQFSYGSGEYNSHTFLQELTWSHEYGLHHVDALLHHENTTNYQETNNVIALDQRDEDVFNLWNFNIAGQVGGNIGEEHAESYLGRVRYNYNQKYFGEFSLRRDGTSRFAKNNRWGTFWSVGASWVISKEKFMQDLLWVDYLKLRAAYGAVGNCFSASAYSYWSVYGNNFNYQDIFNISPAQIPSDDLRWEATKTLDVALEGSLWNDRFGFSVGYFNKRNSDLIFNVSLPVSVGTLSNSGSNPTVTKNIGTMQNIGWELAFNGDVIRTPELTWSLQADATFIKNKVVSLPNHRNIYLGSYIRHEGSSIYEFYLSDFAGVDQLTGRSLYQVHPESFEFQSFDEATQTYRFNESLFNSTLDEARADNSLVEIDGKYYTYNPTWAGKILAGSPLPTVYGSFGTTLSWKGINLSALFTYSLGGKTNDQNYAGYMNVGDTPSAIHKDMLNAWKEAPEGMTADSPNRIDPHGVPQANKEYNSNSNSTESNRWLTSSNYLVFKNLNVSYDLPRKWVAPLQLQNINIGVSIDNIFTATRRKGLNPQQSYSGSQDQTYVTARVFSFQLSARF
ncbi:MAG: SusC/RagA family TonB-linked outer membrane protein [Muribaculaceae bacterium]|nr:SusC/RagA family TonB-linked outer membrane protein [Muribaculaceae bacterium]